MIETVRKSIADLIGIDIRSLQVLDVTVGTIYKWEANTSP